MADNTAISYNQFLILVYNLLLSIKYMHSAGVVHRDLAPKNILVNGNCQVQICDFGWSRTIEEYNEDFCLIGKRQRSLTVDFCTRYYRAPENILRTEHYNNRTDIWSFGCIVAELLKFVLNQENQQEDKKSTRILFKGSSCYPTSPDPESKQEDGTFELSSKDQLVVILRSLGQDAKPSDLYNKDQVDQFSRMQNFAQTLKHTALEHKLKGAPSEMVDFIRKCLTLDQQHRPKADDLLNHEVFSKIRCLEYEQEAKQTISCPVDLIKDKEFSVNKVKKFIMQTVAKI